MDPYLAQIILFAGNFAPRGWAFCDGQLLPITSNTALFSLLGTTYGGDGRTTFGLPDLRGRAPVHAGQGPGLQNLPLGQHGGTETHTLTVAELPSHQHGFKQPCGSSAVNASDNPANKVSAPAGEDIYGDATANTFMSPGVTDAAGSGQAFSVQQPYLALNYIIALVGTFPSRT